MSWEDDPDLPLPEDIDEFGDNDPAEMQCPACGATVSEEAQQCPACGDWITPVEPGGVFSKKGLLVAAVVLMLLAMWLWVF